MSVDVVVVNYHRDDLTERFLLPLEDWDQRVVVVHNGYQEADRRLVGNYTWATHVCLEENLGYAAAVAAGVERCDSDVIAIFNNDVVAQPCEIEACVDALMENPTWGVLGPRQIDGAGRLIHAGIVGTNSAPTWRTWQTVDVGLYNDVISAVTVMGSAYFIKRSVWDELASCPIYVAWRVAQGLPDYGAFLPTFLFYEETYCSYHARAHGYEVIYYGPVCVQHDWHQTVTTFGGAHHMTESRELFRSACLAQGMECD